MRRTILFATLAISLSLSGCATIPPLTPTATTQLRPPTSAPTVVVADTLTAIPQPTTFQPPTISSKSIQLLSPISTWHANRICTLAWSPDSTWFAAGDCDKTYRYLVSGAPPELILSNVNPFAISSAAPSLVYKPWYDDLSILDLISMSRTSTIRLSAPCPLGLVTDLAISSDVSKVAVGIETEGGRDIPTVSTIALWDTVSKVCTIVFPRLQGQIWDLSISQDAKWLIASTNYNDTFLYDTQSLSHTCSFIGLSVQFSPIKDLFALHNSGDNVISLWDPTKCQRTGALWGLEENPQKEVSILDPGAMAFSPDGMLLAAAPCYENGYLRIWDTNESDPIRTITHPSGAICKVAFSPDGRYMATVVRDPTSSVETGDTLVLWAVDQ